MKKTLILPVVLAFAILASFGCATHTAQTTATEQILVTTAAAAGTQSAIQSNPKYAADFAAGAVVLSQLSGGTNQLTVTRVQSILAAAGQTNASVNYIAPLVVNLANSYATQGTNSALNATTQQWLGWIATGMAQGVKMAGY